MLKIMYQEISTPSLEEGSALPHMGRGSRRFLARASELPIPLVLLHLALVAVVVLSVLMSTPVYG